MLENKNSEVGFRQQFELYQIRLKEEEERRKREEETRKQEEARIQREIEERRKQEEREREAEKKRKEEEERKRKEEEERKRPESIAKHKQNIAPFGSDSAELRAYVKEHFDKERKLTNCRGEKTYCVRPGSSCPACPQNSSYVISQIRDGRYH